MIVNNNITQTDPPIKKELAKKYYSDIALENGIELSDQALEFWVSDGDLKNNISRFHTNYGIGNLMPKGESRDSIYSSWLEKEDFEKKNLSQTLPKDLSQSVNVVSVSESLSTHSDTTSLSEQELEDLPEVEINNNRPRILRKVVDNITTQDITGNEGDVEIMLSNKLSPFGYEVSEYGLGENKLEITAPDGEKYNFQLYNDIRSAQVKLTDYVAQDDTAIRTPEEALELKKQNVVDDLKSFLTNKNKSMDMLDGLTMGFSKSDDLIKSISFANQGFVSPGNVNMESINMDSVEFIAELTNMSSFNAFYKDNGDFDIQFFKKKLLQLAEEYPLHPTDPSVEGAKQRAMMTAGGGSIGLLDSSLFLGEEQGFMEDFYGPQAVDQEEYDKYLLGQAITSIYDKIVEQEDFSSRMIAKALTLSGRMKDLDLNDQQVVMDLYDRGLKPEDISTEGIKINGRASSLNDLQDIILNPQGRNAVIKGEIKIDIDDNPDVYGQLSPYVKGAASLVERNSAVDSDTPNAKIAGLMVGDFVQGLGIGALDLAAALGYTMRDGLVALGMHPMVADMSVYGVHGLPILKPSALSYDTVESLKEEYLPLWDKNISDSDSFGEMLALVSEPFTASIPHYAMFAVNPYLGLGTTAVSSYGGTKYEMDQLREATRLQLEEGQALTASQQEILNMSDWDARALALSSASTETAFTALFTMRFFKNMAGAKNFKGTRNLENARKIANSYSKEMRKGLIGNVSRYLGISPRALANEFTEEELVAFSDYGIRIAWGIEEYDAEKAAQLFKDTGLTTMFTSSALSKFAQMGKSRALNKAVENNILSNMSLSNEKTLASQKFYFDGQVQSYRDRGLDDMSNPEFKSAIQLQQQVNDDILNTHKAKIELIEMMEPEHKMSLLNNIVKLEQARTKFSDVNISPDVKRKTQENLQVVYDEMSKVFANYPSLVSYYYQSKPTQMKYDDLAVKELTKEVEEQAETQPGQTLEFNFSQEDISKRAAEIFKRDVIDGKEENRVKFEPKEAYVVINPADLNVELDQEEVRSFNLNNTVSDIRNLRQQVMAFDPKQLEKTDDKFSDDSKLQDLPQFIDMPARFEDILDRLEKYNNDIDFMTSLPDPQRNKIISYLNGIKKSNKDPLIGAGDIESILDAYGIALDISAKNPEKIKVFDSDMTEGSSDLNKLYTKWVNWGQRTFGLGTGLLEGKGFATVDNLLQTVFRDKEVGSEFYNLTRSILNNESVNEREFKGVYDNYSQEYKKEAIEYNKNLPLSKSKMSTDINDPYNAMEQYLLAYAFRKSGVEKTKFRLQDDGSSKEIKLDLEFSRWKTMVEQELALRKEEYENADTKNKKRLKNDYFLMKEAYDRLGFSSAFNFDDLKENANPANISFIEKVASIQDTQTALTRVTDFWGSNYNEKRGTEQPFVDGTYIPMVLYKSPNYKSNNQDTDGDGIRSAVGFKETEFVDSVDKDGLRLNPGMFAKQVIQYTQNNKLDAMSRKDITTLQYLLNNPLFEQQFESKEEYDLIKSVFMGKIRMYDQIVTDGTNDLKGMQDFPFAKQAVGRTIESTYKLLSAGALAGLSQRPKQYVSALGGAYNYLNSGKAKSHALKHLGKFIIGHSGLSTGSTAKTKYKRFIQNSIFGNGDLSNIYNLSRTSLRNSLKAEFDLKDNTKLPLKYYLDHYGVDGEKLDLPEGVSTRLKYNITEFIDWVGNQSEKGLEVFLASADRSAANAAFEAFYIEHRTMQGLDLKGVNMREWWKAENENPDQASIDFADNLIARTMRQTGKMSEAPIYTDPKGAVDFTLKSMFAFQRFVTNARVNFMNQYLILQDPKVPESQKEDARNAMKGVITEVFGFKATNMAIDAALISGLVGVVGFGLEDEEIRERGGLTGFIGEDVLPILDKGYEDLKSGKAPILKTTKEGQAISLLADLDYEEISDIDKAMYYIDRAAREYENQFKIKQDYNALMPVVQETLTMGVPFMLFEGADDMGFAALNKISNLLTGEKPFTEFATGDLVDIGTEGGRLNFIANNLGMFSIATKQSTKVVDAISLALRYQHEIYLGDFGTMKRSVGAKISPERQEKLERAITLNATLRLMNTVNPGPRKEMDRFLTYLQRAIENEFDILEKGTVVDQSAD